MQGILGAGSEPARTLRLHAVTPSRGASLVRVLSLAFATTSDGSPTKFSSSPRSRCVPLASRPFPPNPPDPEFEGLESLREYVMGGVMREMLAAVEKGAKFKQSDVAALVERGTSNGLRALIDDNAVRAKRLEHGTSLLRASNGTTTR